MPNQINATQLTPNATVHIRGKLTFSRLAKLIDGEELANSDAQRRQRKMIPVGRPHTSVSLAHAEVVYADPNAPTTEELFVAERRYTSQQADQGLCYSMDNKSSKLPIVGVQNTADGTVEQVILESDLAAGIDVTLVMRVYKPQGHPNCGLSLDLVLLHEPVRYYNVGVNTGELAARGIIFTTPPKQVSGAEAAAGAAPAAAAAAGLPANTDAATGLPAPAPAVAAVPATPPVMQPAPVAAPVAAAPVAPVAQAAQVFETPEQELARLRAESAARNAASAASGGESAFGSPWDNSQQPVAAQGIAYSG